MVGPSSSSSVSWFSSLKKRTKNNAAEKYTLPLWVVVAILGGLLRCNTVFNGVVWDDRAALTLNKDVNVTATAVSALWRDDYWGQDMTLADSHKSWRPLATLSFRCNFWVHGYQAWGYHLVNVLLHALACGLVCRLASLLLNKEQSSRAPVLTALFFAVHPVHTEAVASIVGRADLLCAVLYLAAAEAYLRSLSSSSQREFGLALLLGSLASMAKEVGISCFLLFPVLELLELFTKKQRRMVVVKCVVSVVAGFMVLNLHTSRHGEHLLYSWTVLENSVAALPFQSRLLSYAHFHALYFGKLLWPLRLCYDYGFPCVAHVESVFDPRNVLALTLYLSAAATGLIALKKRSKVVLQALALLAVPFAPASQIAVPVGTLLGERLLYLPSVGFCLLAALTCDRVYVQKRSSKKGALRLGNIARFLPYSSRIRGLQRLFVGGLFCGGALRSLNRNADWRSEKALFESAMRVCPSSLKVLNNLALVLLSSEEPALYDRAENLLESALLTKSDFASARFNRGLVHHLSERSVAAIFDFERLRLSDQQKEATTYLAQEKWLFTRRAGLENEGRLALLRTALGDLEEQSQDPLTCWATASVSFDLGYFGRAAEEADRAIQLATSSPSSKLRLGPALNLLGLALSATGDKAGALAAYDRGRKIDPELVDIQVNAASLLVDEGRFEEGRELFQSALKLAPTSAELLNNFAYFEERSGNLGTAMELYLKAREILASGGVIHPQIETNIQNLQTRLSETTTT